MGRNDGKSLLSSLVDIDKTIHEPARLAVMALLYVVESADYIFLINQANLTWGNLSAHVSKLEEAGFVEVKKTFKGKRPNTVLKLSPLGRKSFKEYCEKMRELISNFPEE
jgi:DNA-binding MarR family transcriptional regulator